MRTADQWKNWAGNQQSTPTLVYRPATEAALSTAVSNTAARGGKVKVIGSGHSFTAISRPNDVMIDLSDYGRVIRIDSEQQLITVQGGISLRSLNEILDRLDLALPNLGDIDAQTIAGAVSTGTHGTGAGFQSIAAGIVDMRLVTGDGTIAVASPVENPELSDVARVGLGAIGIISELTLHCVPAFGLHAVEEPRQLEDVLANFDDWVDSVDHAEFFWFPHTDIAATKTNTRVPLAPDTRKNWRRVRDEEVMQNALFGAVTRVGSLRPSLVARMAKVVVKNFGRSEYIAPSHAVFTSPRRVRFKEMEYNVPRSALLEAFGRVRNLIDDLSRPVSFPIEIRVLGPDDIALSPAFERESGYIAVHVPAREPHEEYFGGVEEIMNDYGGRPHWGKLHGQTAATMEFRYPRWRAFQSARDLTDPDRRFSNPELAKVLGD